VADAYLDIDKITSNLDARIVVAYRSKIDKKEKQIVGFMTDDFPINMTAQYNEPFVSARQESLSSMMAGVSALASMVKIQVPQVILKSKVQTTSVWTGTARPIFSLPLIFTVIRDSDNVLEEVEKAYETIMALDTEILGLKAGIMSAPLGYQPSVTTEDTPEIDTTIAVSLGQWFRARNLLMKDVNFNISKIIVTNGSPLYASGIISFTPFRDITFSDFRRYFFQFTAPSVGVAGGATPTGGEQ